MNTIYERRKQKGVCTRCGKDKPSTGKFICEPCSIYMKTWAKNNWNSPDGKENRRKRLKIWQQENREYANERARKQLKKLRKQIFEHYGCKCICCGEANIAFLTLDHINNDGKQDREKAGKGNFYYYVKRMGFPVTLQTMCWNCNQAKRIYGTCPHLLFM